jgi:hypothetical protein
MAQAEQRVAQRSRLAPIAACMCLAVALLMLAAHVLLGGDVPVAVFYIDIALVVGGLLCCIWCASVDRPEYGLFAIGASVVALAALGCGVATVVELIH